MATCNCEDVLPSDTEVRGKTLVHKECDSIYDPSLTLREKRDAPTGPGHPEAESRIVNEWPGSDFYQEA